MVFDRHPEFKQKGNGGERVLCGTVGRNEQEKKKYIKNQTIEDKISDR
jgi:hypothetical protein